MFKEVVYDGTCEGAYFLAINLHLTSGKDITFIGAGANGVTGPTKYFDCKAVVTVSPKQLGEAKDVNELIMLLTDGVCDMNGDDEKFLHHQIQENMNSLIGKQEIWKQELQMPMIMCKKF